MQVLLDGKVTVDFKITLANIGDAPCVSGSWWVDFWYEYPCDCDVHPANCNEQPNQSWVSGQDFDSLDGGASVELASEVILDSMPDEMRVVLFADSMFDFCAESYENNNLVCEDLPLQMAMADLAVQDCWIENSQDNPSSVTMSALVKNNSGLPTTQSVSIDFFLDGMSCSEPPFLEPGDTFGEVPPLNSGESILVEVTYPNLPPGMYEPVVLANGFQETPEVKTGNNCCATAPFLQAAFPP
jgi:hypothetical protein